MTSLADQLDAQADALDAQARTLRALAARERRAIGGEMMTIAEAAQHLRRSTRYVREQIRAGRLAARGAGRVVMIARADLDGWIAAQPTRPVRDQTSGDSEIATSDASEVDALAAELREAAE